jgi:ribosome maturation protein Sdo1
VENIKSKVKEVCRNLRKCNYFNIRIESKKLNVKIFAEKMFEEVSTDVYGPINLDNIGHNGVQKKVI